MSTFRRPIVIEQMNPPDLKYAVSGDEWIKRSTSVLGIETTEKYALQINKYGNRKWHLVHTHQEKVSPITVGEFGVYPLGSSTFVTEVDEMGNFYRVATEEGFYPGGPMGGMPVTRDTGLVDPLVDDLI